MLIDSHCHLDFPDFKDDLPAVVARAEAAGVMKMLTICTRFDRFEHVKKIADTYGPIYMAAGIHPHEAGEHGLTDPRQLIDLCTAPKMVGIGETGLDFFYEHSPKLEQEISFRAHIEAAQHTGLPLIVHTRDGEGDTIRILQDMAKSGPYSGLIHCFTGSSYLRDAVLELGMYISISGIATFKKSAELRQILSRVPPDRVLVETDAPYLAPVPNRGRRNEPAFTHHTAAAMALAFDMSFDDFARATTANFHRLFTKVPA